MRSVSNWRRIVGGVGLVVCGMMMQGSSCLPNVAEPLDKVTDTFNNAIAALGSQSTAWRGTLDQLKNDLVQQGQYTLANQVEGLITQAVSAVGIEARCDIEFLKAGLKEELAQMLAKFQHKTIPPPVPRFCNVAPSSVDLRLTGSTRPILEIFGFNLSDRTITVAVVDQSGSRTVPEPGFFNVVSEFKATFNSVNYPFTATSRAVKFALSSGDERSVGIIQAAVCGGIDQPCCAAGTACVLGSGCLSGVCTRCPTYTPPPVQTVTLLEQEDFDGNNCMGVNNLHTYGGPCAAGTHRQQCLVTLKTTNSTGTSCTFESWGSTDTRDCTCRVRFISDRDCFHGIRCTIKITETVDQPPPPPRPVGCP